jgi:hypothetical protein
MSRTLQGLRVQEYGNTLSLHNTMSHERKGTSVAPRSLSEVLTIRTRQMWLVLWAG